MFYYKFRVSYDDVDDFVRDIEILSTDNFESLHHCLYASIGLTGNELASFSVCDSKWNKQNEITLIDMQDDTECNAPAYEEEDDFTTHPNLPKFLMRDAVLKDFISDPHQHIIYEYDFLSPKVFYLELLKIAAVADKISYPRCTLKEKELPKFSRDLKLPDPDDDFDDSIDDADSDFEDGFNDEDRLDLNSVDDYGNI